MPMWSRKKAAGFVVGFLGSLGLVLFYFLVTVLATGDWQFPLKQFWRYRYLMTVLIFGFGVQVGLFQYLLLQTKSGLGTKVSIGASSGVSGLSMVACCAHHLAEILPILGLSAVSLLVSQYQRQWLILGILSNVVGILWMLKQIKNKRIDSFGMKK